MQPAGSRDTNTRPGTYHSVLASYISGITLLGLPAEVYVYGVQFLYGMVGMVLWAAVFNWAILPIFHDLHLMTLYQVRISIFHNISIPKCAFKKCFAFKKEYFSHVSPTQYLQMRYDRRVRMFGSVFFTISLVKFGYCPGG